MAARSGCSCVGDPCPKDKIGLEKDVVQLDQILMKETSDEIQVDSADQSPHQDGFNDVDQVKTELARLGELLENVTSEVADAKMKNDLLNKELAAKDAAISEIDKELAKLRQEAIPSHSHRPSEKTEIAYTESQQKYSMYSQLTLEETAAEEQGSPVGVGDSNTSQDDLTVTSHSRFNLAILKASAFGMAVPLQVLIFMLAFGGYVFVLIMSSPRLFGENSSDHRRLGGDVLPIMKNTAFCMTCAGLIAFAVNLLKQPLILGYLLGGVLVGPIGLEIVPSHLEITELSSLGLIFLLFMVGLELDLMEILKMGKIAFVTGAMQFPTCAGLMYVIFLALNRAGLSFGQGDHALFYCSICCGISSTMLVVKQLSDQGDTHTKHGRLTFSILIFQDIWAIIIIAIQPELENLVVTGILELFAWMAALVVIVLLYAKYIMPAVLVTASKTVELMLVLALAWCFFIGCIAGLPFVGLPMELASLIAGTGLAAFPYSNEFNGKIRYIRDFFITLFFVGLGMQIPSPDIMQILTAFVVAVVVLLGRWIGIFVPVVLLGGPRRLGGMATINLSQVSEFALVICSLGVTKGHVDGDTLTILIWTFAMLAILATYLLKFNHRIYGVLSNSCRRALRMKPMDEDPAAPGEAHSDDERGIVLLGFHRIAAMLIHEFECKTPHLLKQVHVIDFNEELNDQLKERHVKFTYGDYGSADVLQHAHHGEAHIIISTIPDALLKGVTNRRLLQMARAVWPSAYTVMTADNPVQAMELYQEGANYVLRSARLVAERLHGLLSDYSQQVGRSQLANIADVFAAYREDDNNNRPSMNASESLKALKRVTAYVVC